MDKFNINNHQSEGCNRHFDIQKQNGWIDAYTDVPGKQAYEDGLYTGFTNMLKRHMTLRSTLNVLLKKIQKLKQKRYLIL